MRFVGVGGAAPIADLQPFITETGTEGVTHLADESGELWDQFGTSGRSTFLFVNDDGTYQLTEYGSVDEARLTAEVERLIES